jgi:hypothetical protein
MTEFTDELSESRIVQLLPSQKVLMEFTECHGKASEIVRSKEGC